MFRVQSLGGFGGKADQLNAYNVYRGEPDGFDADLARYLSATPASLREAAARWLDPETCRGAGVVPPGLDELALARAEPVEAPRVMADRFDPPASRRRRRRCGFRRSRAAAAERARRLGDRAHARCRS